MADTFEMEIQGLDKLIETFQKMHEDINTDPIIIQAMTKIGKDIEDKAKDFLQEKIYNIPQTPGSTYVRTGMLKARTIAHVPIKDAKGNPRVEVHNDVQSPELRTKIKVRSGQYYAIYVEMGTVKMKARPFLLPAAQMEVECSSKIFAEALNKFLESKVKI